MWKHTVALQIAWGGCSSSVGDGLVKQEKEAALLYYGSLNLIWSFRGTLRRTFSSIV